MVFLEGEMGKVQGLRRVSVDIKTRLRIQVLHRFEHVASSIYYDRKKKTILRKMCKIYNNLRSVNDLVLLHIPKHPYHDSYLFLFLLFFLLLLLLLQT